jgi:hypothetical protein
MNSPANEPTDPKVAFVHVVKDHIKHKPIAEIARLLISDQYADFWQAPFSNGQGRWDSNGGLAEATVLGYRAMRFLMATANNLFSTLDADAENRIVALYLSLMSARWADVRNLHRTFSKFNPASASSVAVANAVAFGIDLKPTEVTALTRWYSSRIELAREFDGFTVEWWVLSETMNWLFVGNRR